MAIKLGQNWKFEIRDGECFEVCDVFMAFCDVLIDTCLSLKKTRFDVFPPGRLLRVIK